MLLGVGVLVEVGRRALYGSAPEGGWMISIACLSLVVNVVVLRMLSPLRDGGVHLRASWIFTRADVVANVGVILSGFLVARLGSRIPDPVIGGLIGNNIERNSDGYDRYASGYRRASAYEVERVPVTRDVQRCNVVNDYRDEIRGYDVRYRYNGRDYSTRTAYDPGPTIQVNVDVRPVYRAPMPSYNRY